MAIPAEIRVPRKVTATVTAAARIRIRRVGEATVIPTTGTVRRTTVMAITGAIRRIQVTGTVTSIRRMAVIIGTRRSVQKILTRGIRIIPRSVPGKTGRMRTVRHRILVSWIPGRSPVVSWKSCRMVSVLSEATITCRETMMCTFLLHRSAGLA